MDAQQILSTARSGDFPSSWFVWGLRSDRILRGIAGWASAGVVFLVVFIFAFLNTVPGNFQRGAFAFIATGLLLIVLATVAFGSLGIAAFDAWRIAHADEYLLVITPDDYVKAEPRRLTHVPMSQVRYVTLKGVKVQRDLGASVPDPRTHPAGFRSGQGLFNPMLTGQRRQPAHAPSVAFQDARTETTVTVATDESFEALPALAEVLRMYAHDDQPMRTF